MTMNARPIIIELPECFGVKDTNDILTTGKSIIFTDWLKKTIAQYDSKDEGYVESLFFSSPLKQYKTGHRSLDDLFNGGLTEGSVNALAGKPGSLKTGLAIDITKTFAEAGISCLICSYEVPKRQYYARILSSYSDNYSWEELEILPALAESAAKLKLQKIAGNIKVTTGWSISEIERAAPNYQFIVIDYIQRMPGKTGDKIYDINFNMERLGNLSRDFGKVIFVLSSIPKDKYDKDSIGSFKDSGSIEYISQTATILRNMDGMLTGHVVKNTRGKTGYFQLECNMAKNIFSEREFNLEV